MAKKVEDEATLQLVGRLDETVNSMSSMLDTLLDVNQLEAGIARREMIDFPVPSPPARPAPGGVAPAAPGSPATWLALAFPLRRTGSTPLSLLVAAHAVILWLRHRRAPMVGVSPPCRPTG